MSDDRISGFHNVHLFDGRGFSSRSHYLVVRDGRIARLGQELHGLIPEEEQLIDGKGCYLAPGFWDLQLNGMAGIDFLSASAEGIKIALRHCLKFGATTVFPTVITESPKRMLETIEAIAAVEDSNDQARIGGIHIEGPMISAGGGKGCHPGIYIRPLAWEEFQAWQEAAQGRVRIITLAPEVEGALELIPRLVGHGVMVAIGHTDASKEVILEAVKRGAKLATHLWNACKKELSRDLEHVGAMLAADELFASFIADGHHIHPDTLKVSFRAKGKEKSILVTDAMSGAGASDGRYFLGDLEIEVVNGVARDPNNLAQLAGSTLTINQAVERAVKFGQITLAEAIRMATVNPASLLSREFEVELKEGKVADLVLFSYQNGQLKIEKVMRLGKLISVDEKDNCPHCGSWKIEQDPRSIWYTDDLGPTVKPENGEWLCWDCGALFDFVSRRIRIFALAVERPQLVRNKPERKEAS